jgi:hypothetical protein
MPPHSKSWIETFLPAEVAGFWPLYKISESGSCDSIVYAPRCGAVPARCHEAGSLASVISLRHWFFHGTRFADGGFQAGLASPTRTESENSFVSDTLGKEMASVE